MTNTQPLLRAIRWNVLFSGASAALMLLTADWVSTQVGLSDSVFVYFAAGALILFALQLSNIVRTGTIRRWEIAIIVGADLAWVAGSIILSAVFFSSITAAGLILVGFVALVVLFLAIQQFRGLQATRP